MAGLSEARDIVHLVMAGDRRALARAATLVEAGGETSRSLIHALFTKTGNAMLVGITGPPGAGKSTLVDQLIAECRTQSLTVAVIAVDPSSPYSRGALLGDRVRMQRHHDDDGVFIRSMATRGRLGGLAQATLDVSLLLDAAGWDVIFIETVGVGQDEVDIAQLADVTVVTLVPGMGDDVQSVKAGIMEIADIFAVNKADLPGADTMVHTIQTMQTLGERTAPGHSALVCKVSAADGMGVPELFSAVKMVFAAKGRQNAQANLWVRRLREHLRETVLYDLPEDLLALKAMQVADRMQDPYSATADLKAELLARGK